MRTLETRAKQNDLPSHGLNCPECGQFVKVYKRVITSTMARWLISLVRKTEKDVRWYSVSEPWSLAICRGTGDIGKLAYWRLIEADENDDPAKRTSGFWRPTREGFQFVYNIIRLPRNALVYDGECIAINGDPVSIKECLGNKFNYESLMSDQL